MDQKATASEETLGNAIRRESARFSALHCEALSGQAVQPAAWQRNVLPANAIQGSARF